MRGFDRVESETFCLCFTDSKSGNGEENLVFTQNGQDLDWCTDKVVGL